jgi:hypothetical protein
MDTTHLKVTFGHVESSCILFSEEQLLFELKIKQKLFIISKKISLISKVHIGQLRNIMDRYFSRC